MKVLPFKVTEFSFRKSAKKVVPFLVVGLMLAAGDSAYAYSGGNGSIARGDDYPAYIKMGVRRLTSGACILVSVLLLQPFA